ncbi:MAG: serine hydrolase domain-containing protein [Pseudomonadota bacterium]
MRISLTGLAFAAALVLTSPASAEMEIADPASIGLDPVKLGEIRTALQRDIAEGRVPGAVMLISRKGKVGFFEAVGQQGPEDATPMSADTIFRIYSMTKPIVSVAAMSMVEDGLMGLDDPIAAYLPEFAHQSVFQQAGESFMVKEDGSRPAKSQATIRDLLRHTSGQIYGVFDSGPLGQLYKDAGVASADIDLDVFSEKMADLPLRFDPGTGWHYGRSTDVLGHVMEIAAGQPLDVILNQRVLDPLGMTDTAFYQDASEAGRIAQPVEPGLFDVTDAKPMMSAGGGLTSTVSDYMKFAMMLRNRGSLNGERVISPMSLHEMTQNQIEGVDLRWYYPSRAYGFGLGFGVRLTEDGPYPGSVGDYFWRGYAGTYFWIDPAEDLFAIFMIQDPANRLHYTGATRGWVYSALAGGS